MVLPLLGALAGPALGLVGTLMGNAQRQQGQERELEAQKEFAQSGVRWKVEDAKKAGIHPLAALGAQTASYAPIGIGDNDLSAGFSAAGQDLSRALDATRTFPEKLDAVGKTMQGLQLQRMGLENELLQAQIAKTRATSAPPFPMATQSPYLLPGQTSALPTGSGSVVDLPLERVAPPASVPQVEPGAVTDLGFTRTGGGFAPVMSDDAKQRMEDDHVSMLVWNIRNRLLPSFGINLTPPAVPGDWHFNPIFQEYAPGSSWFFPTVRRD